MVWTIDDISDQSSKVILITGATSGIGYESAKVLAQRGAHLVLVCRNAEKMSNVADELRTIGAKAVDELVCNMSDLDSVRSCAESYGSGPNINVLLLNAGTGAQSFIPSAQGYERTFATNHFAHWLLTGMLLKKVTERVVVVSSLNHHDAKQINWAIVSGASRLGVRGLDMYSQSKLANMLFVEELNRRLIDVDSSVIAVGVHPGFTCSELLGKVENPGVLYRVSKMMMGVIGQPTQNGAWPLLMAVTDGEINRNCYYAPSKWRLKREMFGPPIRNGRKSQTVFDQVLASKLWEESEKLTDFNYSL